MSLEIIFFIVLFGLIFDYTNGFHDAANVVSTVIATKALRPMTAILMAGVLNIIGATQIGGVAQTISSGLVEAEIATDLLVLSAVVGAIVWNILTWYFGIPGSSSYALIGGLLGAAFFQGGLKIILWNGVIYKVLIPMVISPLLGFFLAFFFMRALHYFFMRREKKNERLFRHLQIASAGCVALAHGLNDAQKSMGLITLGLFAAHLVPTLHIPLWVVLSCALVMGLGTASGGFRIIKTMAYSITDLRPIQGFAAEMSSSLVILGASLWGMPISSTHMIVGSITGVGSERGMQAIRWGTLQKLGFAWILTLPGSGLISYLIYKYVLTVFF
jgi:PiT family inorganic phosphate transporter